MSNKIAILDNDEELERWIEEHPHLKIYVAWSRGHRYTSHYIIYEG